MSATTSIARLFDWQPPAQTYGLRHVGNPEVPTLNAIGAAKGKDWLSAQIATELEKFAKAMGFEKRMSGTAVTQMAINFVREQGQFTFEDVQSFLKGAMLGQYGKFFGMCNQENSLYESLTVDESLNFMAALKGLSGE